MPQRQSAFHLMRLAKRTILNIMQNTPLLFIIIAIVLALAMLLVSWLVRRAARRQMPGARERGTHWIGHASRRDDDFDGDDL